MPPSGRPPAPPSARPPVLVSACLMGVRCRYDGRSSEVVGLEAAIAGREVLALCPEELGGLGTPRPAADLRGGLGEDVLEGRAAVRTGDGRDVTADFVAGARLVLERARAAGVEEAILKERSPSCGCAQVHRDGQVVAGRGVTAAALGRAGIRLRGVG